MKTAMTFFEYAEAYLPEPVKLRYIENLKSINRRDWIDITRKYAISKINFATWPFEIRHTLEGSTYWISVGDIYTRKLRRKNNGD